jgi:hypothetical protein
MKIKILVMQCLKKKFPLSLLDVSVHQTDHATISRVDFDFESDNEDKK